MQEKHENKLKKSSFIAKKTVKKRKILFINQYFYPLQNPPAKRLFAFSNYFAKMNWEVKVITGQPNYPDGKLLKGYNPFFKFENLTQDNNNSSVKVYHLPEIPLKNEGFVKRIINYMSFSVSVFFSFPIIAKSDIVFISSPPLFSSIPAYFWARLFRKKIVFDVRDLWPESAVSVVKMKKNFLYNLFFSIAKKMYRKSDMVTCVTGEMRKTIQSYVKKDIKRDILVINNFAPKRDKFVHKSVSKKIKIVYTGILTKAQGLEAILESNKDKSIKDKFEWHIVGDGDDLISLKEQFKGFDNVFFYGYKDKAFCDEIVKSADLCLVPLADIPIFKMALPSKIMEYTSYGKPVLANWSREMGALIREYDAGYFAEKTKDMKLTLKSIQKKDLLKKSKCAEELFDSVFERDIVCKRLYTAVDSLWQE